MTRRAEHHGTAPWGIAAWKMSGVSKKSSFHCQWLFQPNESENVHPWTGRTPAQKFHDDKNVFEPGLIPCKIN